MGRGLCASGGWAAAGRVLLFYVSCVVVLMIAAPLGSKLPGQWPKIATGLMTSVAAFVLTVVFVRWDGVRLTDVGVALGRKSLARLGLGFVIGSLMVAVQSCCVLAGGHVQWVRAAETGMIAPMALALLAYLLLACREELTFHGYPLRRLEHFFGIWVAQVMVALVFAFEHHAGGFNWVNAMLGASVGSLLFGMASIATRGLAVPIGLHAAWNFGQWVIGEKDLPGLWRPVIDESYKAHVDQVGFVGYLAVFGVVTMAFWFFQVTRARRESAQLLTTKNSE
jgi:membrane protease YdiL (CAAX protease family)